MTTTTQPRARHTDPTTSHAAARTVRATTSAAVRAGVLYVLDRDGRLTDEGIALAYRALVRSKIAPESSPSGLRTRRAELVTRGEVVDSGERVRLASGRQSIVWALARA